MDEKSDVVCITYGGWNLKSCCGRQYLIHTVDGLHTGTIIRLHKDMLGYIGRQGGRGAAGGVSERRAKEREGASVRICLVVPWGKSAEAKVYLVLPGANFAETF